MAFASIWKDRIVTLAAGASYADFEIRLNSVSGALLYAGRSHRRPGAADVTARINDVCADYLGTLRPGTFSPRILMATFVTVVGGAEVDSVTFWDDWSYDTIPAYLNFSILADPVTAVLDPRQVLYFGRLGSATISFTLRYLGGGTTSVSRSVTDGIASLDLSAYANLESVTVGGVPYTVARDGCARYLLHYVNARGSWDSLIVDGYVTRTDSLDRHTALVEYDNADASARGRRDYAVEVTPGWALRTRLLTDEQSARMHNLLNSPDVYLQDFAAGKILPVVLTDTEHDRQSYKGNGLRPNQYTFKAQLAQERYRR